MSPVVLEGGIHWVTSILIMVMHELLLFFPRLASLYMLLGQGLLVCNFYSFNNIFVKKN